MKLTVLFITIGCLTVSAKVLSQKITYSGRNVSLEQVFTQVERQTGLSFLYLQETISNAKPVTIVAENVSLPRFLDMLFKNQPLQYKIESKTIHISRKLTTVLADKRSNIPAAIVSPTVDTLITIRGRVIDEKGEPMNGVSIKVKTSSVATVTDRTGKYVIKAGARDILIFTYVGFTPTEKAITNGREVNVSLRQQDAALDEVVVTALGIRRDEKSLGYAAQTVKENAVKDAKTNNWVNSLSGKVPGLNIQSAGTGPLGSSRITLRGESSLNLDNNQALIVIDGVPVSNKITGTGYSSYLGSDNAVDFGSDVSDLNPEDIESITVLKGPGATALYGSRAAGGALIITTKSGSKTDNGLGITYSVNASIDEVNRWPDYQFEYGEGRTDKYYSYGDSPDGPNTSTDVAAGRTWGPRFAGQLYYQYNPDAPDGKPAERTPWVANEDFVSGYFRTGYTLSNSIAIEGGGDKGGARLSLTHLKNEWILPNTGFQRINASFSFNQKVTNKLKINGKVNYSNKKSDNLPSAGYNNHTVMYFLIAAAAPNIKPHWYKPYWKPGLEHVEQRNPFNPGPDNPFLDVYEMPNKLNKHGVIGTVSANYSFTDKLELMVRSGLDMSFEYRSQSRPFSMTKFPRGMFREQDVFNFEINTDFLLSYKTSIGDNLRYTISGGANAMKQRYDFAGMYADQLSQPGVYQISNSLDQAIADPQHSEKAINSVYAYSQLSYRERIFLDVTGRNDWSSTLPFKNNSFFYPSVSSSFILTDILNLPSQISFAKLRFSWAQVGNDTRPYQTSKYYDRIYGNSFTNPNVLFNPTLKPEITSSYEVGVDARFFRNRLGIDIALYNNNSRNQILATPIDPVTGYASALVNAGLINSKGAEVALTVKPIANKHFSWSTTLNWSTNRSYVKELSEGITNQIIYKHAEGVTIEARVGGRMGDMYGNGFQRTPDGQIIYSSVGLPAALDPVVKKRGNAFADWKAGILNELLINKFRISILVDGQKGGSMYSQTNVKNATLGKTRNTLEGRENGIIGGGVVYNNTIKKYEPNTVKVAASSYYNNYYTIANAETNIFDASFIKIREVRCEYSFGSKILTKAGFKRTTIAVYGRELFNFTNFPAFDPEGGSLNNGTLTPGVELTQFPSSRNLGINLTLKF